MELKASSHLKKWLLIYEQHIKFIQDAMAYQIDSRYRLVLRSIHNLKASCSIILCRLIF